MTGSLHARIRIKQIDSIDTKAIRRQNRSAALGRPAMKLLGGGGGGGGGGGASTSLRSTKHRP